VKVYALVGLNGIGLKVSVILCLLVSSGCANHDDAKWRARRVRPYEDAVPDSRTAIQIAEAVMAPVYGHQYVVAQRPQVAELQGGVWYVHGYQPPISVGGTIEAYIDKHTGRVLVITNGGE
jgi:hypothetical protein